jgi:hypothetical protein
MGRAGDYPRWICPQPNIPRYAAKRDRAAHSGHGVCRTDLEPQLLKPSWHVDSRPGSPDLSAKERVWRMLRSARAACRRTSRPVRARPLLRPARTDQYRYVRGTWCPSECRGLRRSSRRRDRTGTAPAAPSAGGPAFRRIPRGLGATGLEMSGSVSDAQPQWAPFSKGTPARRFGRNPPLQSEYPGAERRRVHRPASSLQRPTQLLRS